MAEPFGSAIHLLADCTLRGMHYVSRKVQNRECCSNMFENSDQLKSYIQENYPEVTDQRIDGSHWDLFCTHCKIVRGFQVIKRDVAVEWVRNYAGDKIQRQEWNAPLTYVYRCPVCSTFKMWLVFEASIKNSEGKYDTHYFKATSIPGEGLEDIEELPSNPPSLRTAYRQAIRAMDANAHLAAAAMFRRALQVITRDLLGAKPGNLANELREVVGKTYNGAQITQSFADIGYIVKEAGNQGAHPDGDPDLLDFTPEDTRDLQNVFMELVTELFVAPAAVKKAKEDFLARRKIAAIKSDKQ